MPGPWLSAAMRSGPRTVIAVLILSLATVGPAVAQQDAPGGRFVPKSLWGVKSDVGLGFAREFGTNYADRSFYEARPSGQGVRVAVIDTGITPSHPDLDGTLACGHCWRDFVDQRTQPYDDNGHGTHVSAIISGNGHWQVNPLKAYFPTGARGLAPESELIVAKAMNASGGGSDARVAESIRWATDPDGEPGTGDEPHILHLSLGVRAPTAEDGQVDAGSKTETAVREAIEDGIIVVMSAGNQGQRDPAPPGNVDGVLAVGGLKSGGEPLPFSNRGPDVDVYAPGVVLSAWPPDLDDDGIEDAYTGLAGTSQAAPVVTGALALAVEANPALTGGDAAKVQHVESIVRSTSHTVSTPDGSLRMLDANALLISQDRGAEDLALGVLTVLGLLALIGLYIVGRMGWHALEGYVERQEDTPPPNGEGPAPTEDQEPTRFERSQD